jgi:hypothetical protein
VTATSEGTAWELELAELLERLSAAQSQLLALLVEKRDCIVRRDHRALAELASREGELAGELQACHRRRQELLAAADAEGLPGGSLSDLSAAIALSRGAQLERSVAEARNRARLIRHECLAQWVAVQRTVLHLSQLLEIIATGGHGQPTYGKGPGGARSGSLMDQAV